MATTPQQRIAYIDWMRGFACLAMFQTHCYDSWVAEPYRHGKFMMWSQLGGTLPAPLFLFLAGISFAMVTDGLRRKGLPASSVARATIRRGAEILGFGLLFRLQEYLLGLPWAPWTDLLRVDVLNVIGVSMMLMGCVCWAAAARDGDIRAQRVRGVWTSVSAAMLISLATPPLWTTWRPSWLPWPLESYINGVHIYDKPQPWLFPIFPWAAFAFAGLACGFLLMGDWARQSTLKATAALGTLGIAIAAFSVWADSQPRQLYAEYDYWHTSPNFFLMRIGILLVILLFAYSWCRWGLGRLRRDPLVQLGKTSLLVYWVHIEFVYGRFSFLPKRGTTIAVASLGLLIIFVAMLGLSFARTRFKGRGLAITEWWKKPAPMAAPSA